MDIVLLVLNRFATPPPSPLFSVLELFSPVSAMRVLASIPVCAYPASDACPVCVSPFFFAAITPVVIQPMEIYVDDETKLTLHGLQQYYIKLAETEKNRKLNDLLDLLEFNQVRRHYEQCCRCTMHPRLMNFNEESKRRGEARYDELHCLATCSSQIF